MARHRWTDFARDAATQTRLALPIMGAQLALVGMGAADTIIVGRYSAHDLAAVAVGSSIWFPALLFLSGVLMAVTPHVARLYGGGRARELGAYLGNALWLGVVAGGLAAAALLLAERGLAVSGIDPGVCRSAAAYLAGVAAGMPAIGVFQVLRSLCEGLHDTRPILWVSLVGLAVDAPANYLLVFGGFGVPPLGALGCGIATGLAMWTMTGALWLYVRRAPAYTATGLFERRWRLRRAPTLHVLRVGLPIGLSLFFEVTLFAAITLLVAGLGTTVVAAHQIALNVSTVLFMVPLSLGMALTVRVGFARGGDDPAAARRCAANGMRLGGFLGLVQAGCMLVGAEYAVRLYTADPAVRDLAVSLIRLAAFFQLSDTLQVTAAGALRGYEATRSIMLITLPSYWLVGLGTGIWLALSDLPPGPLGVHGFWIGMLAGLSVAAALLAWRLRVVGRAAAA
ncbi:multidrug resistance protein, MATE family [Salinisphaera sp. PC39]|uniref:MATE family efflux transporter n=1 Tax=Salinisphaera sp. PC39 TaxID=1304156 RepID=UPI00333F42B3